MDFMASQLYEVMSQNNWSIRVAADFMGIGRNVLARILDRKYNMHLSTIFRIAENLDRSVASLICPEDAQKRETELLLHQIHADLERLQKGGAA